MQTKSLFLSLVLLAVGGSLQAAPAITVSASAVTLLGTTQQISITVTLIDPNNTGMLKVSGTGIVPIMRASTVTPGTTATVGPIYGNDVILDGYGNSNTTYYQVQVFTYTAPFVSSTPSLSNFYAFTGSGTVDLATATPLAPSFMSGPLGSVVVPGSLTVSGTQTNTGTLNTAITNNAPLACNTSLVFQYQTLAAAYAALPGSGKVEVCDGHAETMASTLTINKAHSGFVFLGQANITCPTTAIGCVNVVAGTHGVFFYGVVPFGGGDTTSGARFFYSGSGVGIQVGASSATTRMFGWSNVAVNLTGGAIGAATGLYMTNVVFFDFENFASFNGSSSTTTTGLVCDGTGNFCGNGKISNPEIIGHKIGILGTGSGGVTNCMNAVEISGAQRIQQGASLSGSVGIDFECANDNTIVSVDMESNAIALKLGANATDNRGMIRSEANTTDIQALAGSQNNRIEVQTSSFGSAAVVVSDSGTNNHFSRAVDGNFSSISVGQGGTPGAANLYSANFSRSLGNPGFPDITGNGSAPVVLGDSFGTRLVPATSNFIGNSAGTAFQGLTLKTGSGAGYTGTNTALAAVDTTNLCTTITVPTGWKLFVSASGVGQQNTAAAGISIALADAGVTCTSGGIAALVGSQRDFTPPAVATNNEGFHTQYVLTGDGAAHSIALVAKTANAADAWVIVNSSAVSTPSMVFQLMPSN